MHLESYHSYVTIRIPLMIKIKFIGQLIKISFLVVDVVIIIALVR